MVSQCFSVKEGDVSWVLVGEEDAGTENKPITGDDKIDEIQSQWLI